MAQAKQNLRFGGASVRFRSRFDVVAAVLTHEGRLALFRRSRLVTGDVGRWHCITGFLPSGQSPLRQAFREVDEEAGINADQLRLTSAEIVERKGDDGNMWRVHAFSFRCLTESVRLNWEHDEVRWLPLDKSGALLTVPWLGNVIEALSARHLRTGPPLRGLRPTSRQTLAIRSIAPCRVWENGGTHCALG